MVISCKLTFSRVYTLPLGRRYLTLTGQILLY